MRGVNCRFAGRRESLAIWILAIFGRERIGVRWIGGRIFNSFEAFAVRL